MDYTAIVVAFISLIGVIWQGSHNAKQIRKQDIKAELKDVHDKLSIIGNGQEFVLQDRLMYLCKKYIERGSVSTIELKLLTNMYHAYHDLGGNDFITDLFERAKNLPLKDEDDN